MLKIFIDKRYYKPGENVNGNIVLDIPTDMYIQRGVLNAQYELNGYDPLRRIIYREKYLDWQYQFIKSKNLKKGVYTYNFTFKIPENAPPSYRGRYIESILKYDAYVNSPTLLPYTARGEIYVINEYVGKVRERTISGGGGDISFSLVIEEPILGTEELDGILLLHKIPDVKRISFEICISETIRHAQLGIFRHEYNISKCIVRKSYIISEKGLKELRFSIDLTQTSKRSFIYTAPYENDRIRIQPYLRIIFFRIGRKERVYEIPFQWYIWKGEIYESRETLVMKEIRKYRDRVFRMITEYFEDHDEGDAMDIYLYLIKKGFETSIDEVNKILDNLVEDGILRIDSEDTLFKKYRVNV